MVADPAAQDILTTAAPALRPVPTNLLATAEEVIDLQRPTTATLAAAGRPVCPLSICSFQPYHRTEERAL
jgi:hypothetical protein